MLKLVPLLSCALAIATLNGAEALDKLRNADLPVPTNLVLCNCEEKINSFFTDLNALAKVCSNSTVINPDKKKTPQGPSSCIFDKLGCFQGQDQCAMKDKDKVDCGKVGTTQQSCEKDGCCWMPIKPNPSNLPWCYRKSKVTLPSERTKVDWDKFKVKFLGRDDIVKLCKDSDYDTDGGFWDDVGDWFFGENFDYASLEKALTNFFNCCKSKLVKECEDKFSKKVPKPV